MYSTVPSKMSSVVTSSNTVWNISVCASTMKAVGTAFRASMTTRTSIGSMEPSLLASSPANGSTGSSLPSPSAPVEGVRIADWSEYCWTDMDPNRLRVSMIRRASTGLIAPFRSTSAGLAALKSETSCGGDWQTTN